MNALHSAPGTGIGYNPGVTNRAGELFAQGISQAGGAVSSAIQQFAKNREQRDFLDQERQGVAAELGKYKNFEVEAKDDTSPAGQAIKTLANWDNLSLAKQQAAIMNGRLLIQKSEAQQLRAEENQYRLLAAQHQQAQEERTGKHQADMLGVSRQGMALEGLRTLGGLWNQGQDNSRANRSLALAEDRARRAEGEHKALTDRITADRAAWRSLLQLQQPLTGDEQGPIPTTTFNAGRATQQTGGNIPAEDIAALEKMNRAGFAPSGHTVRVGGWNVPVVTTSNGQAQLLPELATADDGTNNPRYNKPPAESKLAPQALSAVLKAESRYSDALTKFGSNRADPKLQAELNAAIANLNHMKRVTGAKAPASAPASAPAPASGEHAIKYKLVNGQLVQE